MIYVCIIYVYIYVYMYAYMYVCIYGYMYVYIYVHNYMYVHIIPSTNPFSNKNCKTSNICRPYFFTSNKVRARRGGGLEYLVRKVLPGRCYEAWPVINITFKE